LKYLASSGTKDEGPLSCNDSAYPKSLKRCLCDDTGDARINNDFVGRYLELHSILFSQGVIESHNGQPYFFPVFHRMRLCFGSPKTVGTTILIPFRGRLSDICWICFILNCLAYIGRVTMDG
jgi:hypothetical protein